MDSTEHVGMIVNTKQKAHGTSSQSDGSKEALDIILYFSLVS